MHHKQCVQQEVIQAVEHRRGDHIGDGREPPLDDMVFRNEEDKFEAIIKTVEEAHAKGQPILIGTVSIDKSERLSELLNKAGIKHNLLTLLLRSHLGST